MQVDMTAWLPKSEFQKILQPLVQSEEVRRASMNQQSILILALGPEKMADTTTADTDSEKKGYRE